jgi:glutamine synthetase
MASDGGRRRGLLSLEELRVAIGDGEIDTVVLAFTDMQGRLQGKRLSAEFFCEEVAENFSEGCNYLLAVDVEMNTVDGYAMSSWAKGYGDFVMRPDLATLRPMPWEAASVLCLADLVWADGSDVVASPRQVLRAQLARLADRGWTANAATELEFLVFRDSYEEAWRKGYRDLEPANQYNVDYSLLGTSRVEPLIRRIRNSMAGAELEVENSKGECNDGQHEINFRYADAFTTPSTRTEPRRSPPRRAWRSASWRSSTSARATRATSTSRSPTAMGRCSIATDRCSSRSSLGSWPTRAS